MQKKTIGKLCAFGVVLALFVLAVFLFSRPEPEDPIWEFVLDGRTYWIQEDSISESAEKSAAQKEWAYGTFVEYYPELADTYVQDAGEILDERLPDDLTKVGVLTWTADEPAADFFCNGPETLDGAQVYTSAENPGYAWILSGEDWYQSTWWLMENNYLCADGDYFVEAAEANFESNRAFARYLRSLPDFSEKMAEYSWKDAAEREDWFETAQLWGTARLVGEIAELIDNMTEPYQTPGDACKLVTFIEPGDKRLYNEKYLGAQVWALAEYPNMLLVCCNDGTTEAFWRYGELPPE